MVHTILLSFELPDGTPMSDVLAADLEDMDVVALGHFALPEQTPPEVGRDQFEGEATAELDALVRPLTDRGADVRTRLVFGRARDRTINRIVEEERCDVVFTPGEGDPSSIDRLFVPVRGRENLDGLLSFAADLALDCDASVTLFHEAEATDRVPAEELLQDAHDRLVEYGVEAAHVEQELAEGEDVESDIVARANEFDAVVIGETEPSVEDRLLGRRPAGITRDTTSPTFVVGNPDVHE